MSDQAEKTCPLCAEEMDLTDQQLKPCKCGYEICIWCWHHIMDMAEKNDAKGRCPACRTPYNKEEIVGMSAKCERLVAEMHMEKKMKSQKPKSKAFDGRKQLINVRVIQRNLAYIVGLPLNLADEDLLQRREYFSQYGKVLKVSISRTSAGTIQQFANNTCSVYITYSKEEEAVRCIQSVHSFVLDGRSLRACFGTTKYCHAWLRNLPCNNSDCLYLHEIGSQEDSFTKDEVVSEYTRGRVQQITGPTNSMQRRSGDMLPPPADEYYINSSVSSGKSLSKSASSHNPASSVSGSPPNSSSGLSVALPGATFWEVRALNNQPPSGNVASSNAPSNQKHETCNGSIAFSTEVGGSIQVPPSYMDVENKHIPKGECRTTASEAPATPGVSATRTVDVQLHSPGLLKGKHRCISAAPNNTNSSNFSGQSFRFDTDKDLNISANGNIQSICSDMGSLHVERRLGDEHFAEDREVGHPNLLPSEVEKNILARVENQPSDADRNVASDLGESNIISNILSIEWDESLTLPQNLVKLLDDNNRWDPSLKPSSSWKVQNSSQSRFSFAREEESKNEVSDVGPSLNNSRRAMKDHALGLEFSESSNSSIDKHGDFNGFSAFTVDESKNFPGSCSYLSSNKPSVSRAQVSAPPGFTGPSKAPPPGFSCNERTEPTLDAMSWNGFVDTSLLRNPYEAPPTGHIGSGDIEFMDPAILAVGKGRLPSGLNNDASLDMRSNYSSQLSSAFENEARLQLLMQRSLSPLQNQRFTDFGGGFAPHSDAYRIPSRTMERTLASSPSPLSQPNLQQSRSAMMSNGQRDGWNEVHSRK